MHGGLANPSVNVVAYLLGVSETLGSNFTYLPNADDDDVLLIEV